jgi:hypothetical protein
MRRMRLLSRNFSSFSVPVERRDHLKFARQSDPSPVGMARSAANPTALRTERTLEVSGSETSASPTRLWLAIRSQFSVCWELPFGERIPVDPLDLLARIEQGVGSKRFCIGSSIPYIGAFAPNRFWRGRVSRNTWIALACLERILGLSSRHCSRTMAQTLRA